MKDGLSARKILCGVGASSEDGGALAVCEADRHTVRQASQLAARVGAALRLVHVVDWFEEHETGHGRQVAEAVAQDLEADFREIESEATGLGVAFDFELRRGRPAEELVRAAEDWGAELVAISPRRSDPRLLERIVYGSTTRRVLRTATCPVWVIEPSSGEVRRILALIDRSAASPSVVDAASALARTFSAELFALCCLDYPDDVALHRLPSADREIRLYHKEVRAQAWADLERLTAADDVSWKLTLGEDWVVRAAPQMILDKKIDLVVLAAVSKPRLAGAVLGSTAARLLDRVGVSTWVLRGGAAPSVDDL